MRRAFLATLTLAALVMFAGCSDQEPTSPAEPSFGKRPSTDCLDGTLTGQLRDEIRADIGNLFADRKTKKAAGGQINNIERKLCKDPLPQYDDATNMAWDFLRFTNGKIPNKFTGEAADAADLTSKVFALAADPAATDPPLEIPDGAFLETGGVITFDPEDASETDPIVASTENGEAAVVIDNPDAFPPGTGPVTIVLSRAAGDDVVEPGEFIPGFQAYEEGYQILSSHQPDPNGGGVIIALCLVPETAPTNLVIGHLHGSSVELLVPTDPDPEFLNYIDCTNATATTVAMNIVAPPGWLQYARRLVQPVVKLFEPKPLNAMLFRGRGLGGRTTSLSLDAPVDPTIDVGETVQLSVGTDATWTSDATGVATVGATTGLVLGVGPGTATITADFGAEESLSMVITVLPPPVVPGMIDFDFAPDASPILSGTLVNDLYALAGVTFGHGGAGTLCGTNVYANDSVVPGLPAPSLPNRVSLCTEGTASDISENTFGFISATFGPFVSEVCLDVSTIAGQSGFLAAYSQSGALLERATTPVGPAGATQPLCVTRPDPDIVAVAFSGDGNLFAMFDNLDFAAGPGGSNQIAFVGLGDIRLMNANGTLETNVTGGVVANGRAPSWSPDGQRMAFYGISGAGIYLINPDGTGLSGPLGPTGAWQPAWSPLGDQIAYKESTGGIGVMNVDGTNQVQIAVAGSSPAWSPDGMKIAYSLSNDIYVINASGSGSALNVTNSATTSDHTAAWSPDGIEMKIAFTRDWDIYVINADGSGTPLNVTNTTTDNENQVDWSPDGTMLAFWSNRVGSDQIFIQPADGSGPAIQLTFGGVNFDPAWRP